MKIAIDAMGGDHAPVVPVAAAIEAYKAGISVALVGKENLIQEQLTSRNFDPALISIFDAPEVIKMDEEIGSASLRKKSSLRVCYELHKTDKVQAVISAGHSGALLALGKLLLRTIKGVERPCIGALMPSKKGHVLLADAGANIDCSAHHLFQFGVLAASYLECVFNQANPKVGLLNIGEEEAKGTPAVKEAHRLFKNSNLNFVGNIEGKMFFLGEHDIVVCDGFAGNVLLKSVQGAEAFIRYLIKDQVAQSWLNKLGALFLVKMFRQLKDHTDYSNYGGAPLLGLNGVAIVCHGSSSVNAIFSAIKFTDWALKNNLVNKIREHIAFYQSNHL